MSRSQNTCGVTHYTAILNDGRLQLDCRATPARPRQSTPRVNQQTLASVNQHRHHHSCRDILNLIVARLSSRLSRHSKSPDQINLMTLHSSKGLEFQAVIMVGLENGVFPSGFDRTDEQLEEAARLFYVGVTRAKTQIHLTYDSDESPLITSIREAA
ncbi:3'-5' exonuclease [Paraburkholderia xenovorans]|uniref:3'-5' exonuclease n=1 Tax=Paraburkholderia xenovorans TaxID=36873 RepID=UPI000320B244|nr:3'-5' exonuclease [Paraburkholderia xenovorans]